MNILFLIFNRPEETDRVFEMIRLAKPAKLFVAADGPRKEKEADGELCMMTRAVIKRVDWPCELFTRYQESNLGCKQHVSSAIGWFFESVEEGIILEDDCLPDPSFFDYCNELLDLYRHDDRIMHISGANFLPSPDGTKASYSFSHIPHIWGWATWRRAWKEYDLEMTALDPLKERGCFAELFKDKTIGDFWLSLFLHIRKKKVDTWDAAWAYAIMRQEGICVTPHINLVENIGFKAGTHSVQSDMYQNGPRQHLDNIVHPENIEVNAERDRAEAYLLYIEPWHRKLVRRISKLLKMS